MSYSLFLSENDLETIAFVGDRYEWSLSLRSLSYGHNEIPEHIAWQIKEAFDSDTEGGHDMFPMLDGRSDLCGKLVRFYESIV